MTTPAHHRTDGQGWPTPWPARRKATWPSLSVTSDGPASEWVDQARCHGRWDLFDPGDYGVTPAEQLAEAQAICRTCPVFDPCREFAETARPPVVGIWAGRRRYANATTREGTTTA